MKKDKELLNGTDVTKHVGISQATLWRWVKHGKIKPIMFGKQKMYVLKEVKKLKK